MKKSRNNFLIFGLLALLVTLYACKKSFLTRDPIGQISEVTLNNKAGVNGLLIGAYSLLDGSGIDNWFISSANSSVWNAWAGSSSTDDAHKGGGFGSQGERSELENKKYTAQNAVLHDRWRYFYGGIQRANEAIRALNKLPGGEVTTEEALQIRAEAIFLRGVYHLEAAQMWRNIPYVDETVTFNAGNYNVSNRPEKYAWAKIEENFKYAAENLTAVKSQIGRANKWAAKGFLAKAYMQQGKMAEAKVVLDDIIANGVTAGGTPYNLEPQFANIFRAKHDNGPEAVFAVQMSVNDGGDGRNGNEGESFNYPGTAGSQSFGGWGHMPSFNLVNAYKTVNGLPMLDNFNDVDVKNNFTLKSTDPFTPYTGTLDPRLDWTVARRGIPFHDWGNHIEDPNPQAGPYKGKKWVYWKEETGGKGSELVDGWQYTSGINFNMIRFSDVLLWAAECEVELGDLQKAEDLVNRVRTRAANPAGFLKKYVNDADPSLGFSNAPAANYVITTYSGANGFVVKGKDYARKAVRFERRLEFAMEGQRFYDLQRYDLQQPGYMADLLNKYMPEEVAKFESYLPSPQTYDILKGAVFVKGKHEIYAIPQAEIDQSADASGPTLIQNPGHN